MIFQGSSLLNKVFAWLSFQKLRADSMQRKNLCVEELDAMFIKMKELAATGTLGKFCTNLEKNANGKKEIILDFKGVQEVQNGDAEKLMTVCLKLKKKGNIIRLKDMSLIVRNQFLMSAINYAKDEVLL
jgi:hypothetical protein